MFKNPAQRAKLFELLKQHSLGQAPAASPSVPISHASSIPTLLPPKPLAPIPPMHTAPTVSPQATNISASPAISLSKNNFSRLNNIIKPVKAKAPKSLKMPKV